MVPNKNDPIKVLPTKINPRDRMIFRLKKTELLPTRGYFKKMKQAVLLSLPKHSSVKIIMERI
jgi:hypothetical protein